VEADKLLLQDLLRISDDVEVLNVLLLIIELRIWLNGSLVLTLDTFVSISVVNFGLGSLSFSVIIDETIVTLKQERLELNENTLDSIGGSPATILGSVLLEHVQTESRTKHIRVSDRGEHFDGRWADRVVLREIDLDVEHATFVLGVGRTSDIGMPGEHVVVEWCGSDTVKGDLTLTDGLQIFLKTSDRVRLVSKDI